MEPLVVSQIVLWIVVVALALTVAALARQIGVPPSTSGSRHRSST